MLESLGGQYKELKKVSFFTQLPFSHLSSSS